MIGSLGHSCFLKHQCFLCSKQVGSNGKAWPLRSLVIDLICLPTLALSLTELPCIVNSLKFCAHGALGMLAYK